MLESGQIMHHIATINEFLRQLHQRRVDSLLSEQGSKSDFWPFLRMPCLDRDVDNPNSRLQTGGI